MIKSRGAGENAGKKTGARLFTFFAIIIAAVSAVVLWLYVLGYDSPNYEKEFNVPVTVEGESELRQSAGLTIISEFGFNIKVTVSGPQTEVNKLRADDIKAYIDVSSVAKAGKCSLPIYVTLPNENKIAVSRKSVEEAIVYIDEAVVAEIPVKLDITDYTLPADYSLGDYTISPVTVTVRGPRAELDAISYAYASITPGEIDRSINANVKVTLHAENGAAVNNSYIELLDPTVEVHVPVKMVKTVPVNVYFVGGYFGTEAAQIERSHEFIRIKGTTEDLEKIDEIKINIVENTLVSEYVTKIITLPEGVESVDNVTGVQVRITFNDLVRRVITVSPSAISEILLPEGFSGKVNDSAVNVTVFGHPQDLLHLSGGDMLGTVDLTGFELEAGKNYFAGVKFAFTGAYAETPGLFVSGEYGVNVTVSAAEIPSVPAEGDNNLND